MLEEEAVRSGNTERFVITIDLLQHGVRLPGAVLFDKIIKAKELLSVRILCC